MVLGALEDTDSVSSDPSSSYWLDSESFSDLEGFGSDESLPSIVSQSLDQSQDTPIRSSSSIFERLCSVIFSSNWDFKVEKYTRVLKGYLDNIGERHAEGVIKDLNVRFNPNNSLVKHLTRAYSIVAGEGNFKDDRDRYQAFVKELRATIETKQYQAILSKDPNKLTLPEKQVLELTRALVTARWFETEMYDYLKEGVDHYERAYHEETGTVVPERNLTEENFPEKLEEMNRKIEGAPNRVKKSELTLGIQKLEGAVGLKDFTATENVPYVRCTYEYENEKGETRKIKYLRHSRPTMGGGIGGFIGGVVSRCATKLFGGERRHDGEMIAPDYEEGIRALHARGEGMLYVVHQRRSVGVFENEGDSTALIEGLDQKHKNFHTLIQGVEGDLYSREGKYASCRTAGQLKDALLTSFNEGPNSPNALPRLVQNNDEYKEVMVQLFDKVMALYEKKDGSEITVDEWKEMTQLFYIFQKDDLKFRLPNITHYTAICKDFLDRAGNQAMVEDVVHYNMTPDGLSPTDLESTFNNTAGPPIFVKKTKLVWRRLVDGLRIITKLAESPEKKAYLKTVSFGEEKWKLKKVHQANSVAT